MACQDLAMLSLAQGIWVEIYKIPRWGLLENIKQSNIDSVVLSCSYIVSDDCLFATLDWWMTSNHQDLWDK